MITGLAVLIFVIGAVLGILIPVVVRSLRRRGLERSLNRFGRAVAARGRKFPLTLLKLAVPLILGFFIGVAFSQGARVLEPARTLLGTTETLDRDLTTALVALQPVSTALLQVRADLDRIERLPQTDVQAAAANRDLARTLSHLQAGLWRQNQVYERALLAARASTRTRREDLERIVSHNGGWPDKTFAGTRDFAVWVGPTLMLTLLLILALVLALTNPRIRELIGRSGTFSLWGFTISLQDINTLRANVRDWVAQLDRDISKIYIKNLADTGLDEAFVTLKAKIDDVFAQFGVDLKQTRHRANIFVPGFAGDELVQATPYLGANMTLARVGVGRRFSARYGMVGKCWRLGEALYNPDVSNVGDKLIRDWGLTRSEASQQGGVSKSLMGFPLHEGKPGADALGVVYVEAEGVGVLRPADLAVTPMFRGKTIPAKLDDDGFARLIWKELSASPAMKAVVKELKELHKKLEWETKAIDQPGR